MAKKILFINQEIVPYVPDSDLSLMGKALPQAILEKGHEIRTFMPKWGNINERRGQLHEVIRLSGMNLIIDDTDHPLIIKVATIVQTRIQVYFIDNDDYFSKRQMAQNEQGEDYADNGERAIFFARGVLETVKKLRWQPTIIHCSGWLAALVPLYLKKTFKADPIFTDSKIIVSIYDEIGKERFSSSFAKKIIANNIKPSDVELLNTPTGTNLAKIAVKYADGVIFGSKNVSKEITDFAAKEKIPSLAYSEITEGNTAAYTSKYIKFYGKFLKE